MREPKIIGRYAIHGEIAAGGMATVHFGRLLGPVGFSRTVAIKQLHPRYARDPEFVSMFLDEARLASRIQHPNVVATVDVVAEHDELFLVMEYVQGESLGRLIRMSQERMLPVPPRIAASIVSGVLHGLHAAHEARDTRGELMSVVHRDVSPQNVMVGADGIARVVDFGVAKAQGRAQTTREGHLKGKLAYMAPEQLRGEVTRRTDVFAAAIVLWETLTCRRLFAGDNEGEVLAKLTSLEIAAPSTQNAEISPAFDAVVLRGLCRDPEGRFATAREMALAIEEHAPLAAPSEVGAWVEMLAGVLLSDRAMHLREIESDPGSPMTSPDFVPPRPHPATTRVPDMVTLSMPGVGSSAAPPAPSPAPRASGSRWLSLALATCVGLIFGVVALAWMRRNPPPLAVATATASSPAPPAPEIMADAAFAQAPPAIAPSPPPTHAASPRRPPRVSPGTTKSHALPANSCDPPYVRGPDGKLSPKAGCL